MTDEGQKTTLADDILKGADEIGAYTGDSPRRVFYLAERGLIPVFRIGNLLHGRKSELDKRYTAENAPEDTTTAV